ncbi:MAG: UTP--glucose-1-phosphate uridylyltransferase [Proteobacteria bacterium]|nr:UTP--glucose-1-phosphate uridylyltransferase [Pseudomonadota bacterium]
MSSARNNKPVRKAVFPVAGLGTRFLPATKVLPKEILPLNDRPVIQHSWEEARAAGIEEFIFVSHPRKDILQKHFEAQPDLEKILEAGNKKEWLAAVRESTLPAEKLHVTYQPEPLGLGHAVWCAKGLVGDEPFAVILPDDVFIADKPCLAQMADIYNECGGNIVAVMEVAREETARYGVVDIKKDSGHLVDIKGLVEKPKPENAPSTLAVLGRYILQPEIFEHLEKGEKGAGGEIQLTDAMAKLIGVQPFHGYRFSGARYDCGTRAGFLEASIAFAMSDPEMKEEAESILKKIIDKNRTAA